MGTLVSGAVLKGLANVGQYALPIILTGAAVASFLGRRQREVPAQMAAHGAAGGFVVTSGVFTSDAEAFAKGRNIGLIDGSALTGMIEGAKSARPVGMPAAQVAASGEPPACPKCGSAMVRRTARQGANIGASFWGCSAFPKCRGVRAIE